MIDVCNLVFAGHRLALMCRSFLFQNIELRVMVEGLKAEMDDKQDLLRKARYRFVWCVRVWLRCCLCGDVCDDV